MQLQVKLQETPEKTNLEAKKPKAMFCVTHVEVSKKEKGYI